MRLSAVVLALSLVGMVAPARAESAEDVIVTRDGAILRGHVTEMRPGKTATIVLLNGESRVVKWDDIAKSTGPSFPSEKPAAPAEEHVDILKPCAGRVPYVVESAGKQQRLALHVSSGVSVNGFVFTVAAEVCRTPCTLYLPPGDYGIESWGEGVTHAFTHIEVGASGGHLKLRAGRAGVYKAGVGLIVLGAITAIVGGSLMATGGLISSTSHASTTNSGDSLLLGGGITLGAGAALIIPGAVMVATAKGGAVEKDSYEKAPPARTLQVNAMPLKDGGFVGATVRF